jgi:hypothetical protein
MEGVQKPGNSESFHSFRGKEIKGKIAPVLNPLKTKCIPNNI